ncbi:HAMP domain-containing histidine kinase [Deltaproteobacteria bacterium OttesenSCG-928-M10]|nr:HAMP domain-containing histidine kinase [Deltaproteobacteria bacterium OttesenSCG-928-M10]
MEAIFLSPGNVRDAEAFLQKAKKEAELTTRAKNEFLSNISHELRTPLNIIIGMLDLALEDESAGEDLRLNLSLAKDAADGLFIVLNDLIVLSNLEARRLVSDVAQFSPQLLLQALVRQFAAKAGEKRIRLETESDQNGESIFEGGYNLIVMALEKLVDNAIKFSCASGRVLIRATVAEKDDGPWLYCAVLDDGPGLDESFIKAREQDLFRQGDGSMNRQHGGLGLGLRLAANLAATLGGRLTLANRPEGGADIGFFVPIKIRPG